MTVDQFITLKQTYLREAMNTGSLETEHFSNHNIVNISNTKYENKHSKTEAENNATLCMVNGEKASLLSSIASVYLSLCKKYDFGHIDDDGDFIAGRENDESYKSDNVLERHLGALKQIVGSSQMYIDKTFYH